MERDFIQGDRKRLSDLVTVEHSGMRCEPSNVTSRQRGYGRSCEDGIALENQQEDIANGMAHAQDKTHELELQTTRGCEGLGAVR